MSTMIFVTCPHCHREIPEDQIASFDLSGCPLAKPCVSPGHLAAETAWPIEDDDDDEGGEQISREPLAGGAF